MIHRTFRSLDDAPKLVGFTIRQWAALIADSLLVLGFVHLARLGTKPAITLGVFAVGLPGALVYVSESGGLALGVLLADMCRWRLGAKQLPAARAGLTPARGVVIAAATEQSASASEQPGEDELPGRPGQLA